MKAKRPDVSKDFHHRLKSLRLGKKWSQGQLAKEIGCAPNRISRYEGGAVFPTTDVMVKFSEIFGVSLDYLIKGHGEPDFEAIQNNELVRRIEKISRLGDEEQRALIIVMDSLIKNQELDEKKTRQ